MNADQNKARSTSLLRSSAFIRGKFSCLAFSSSLGDLGVFAFAFMIF
jgi:hypothetical protein